MSGGRDFNKHKNDLNMLFMLCCRCFKNQQKTFVFQWFFNGLQCNLRTVSGGRPLKSLAEGRITCRTVYAGRPLICVVEARARSRTFFAEGRIT